MEKAIRIKKANLFIYSMNNSVTVVVDKIAKMKLLHKSPCLGNCTYFYMTIEFRN